MSLSAHCFSLLLAVACFVSQISPHAQAAPASKPNIIVILADDLGWPDLGIMGATDFPTPHIDSLATNGVRFLNGYVSSPICSPSRAGFITGRYQERFGHEINPGPQLERNPIFGVPLTQEIIGNRLKDLGYATGWIGKSHLGGAPEYHPLQRGFDQFFGFIEGHHDYIYPYDDDHDPIMAGATSTGPTNANETAYLTTAFQRECVNFIRSHTNQPFFLYAPFNAIHFPLQAETNHFAGLNTNLYSTVPRYIAAAMMRALDNAVGDILTNLTQLNLLTNTLIFFTSDNGAPAPTGLDRNGSVNFPLRGYKGSLYEGGVRVPFLVQWAGQIPPRVDSNTVVSTLDIVPTCIAAGGGTIQPAWKLDGQNLIPFLKQQSAQSTRDLFWRLETAGGDGIPPGPGAIRSGDWKMVKPSRGSNWELYDLATDISEATNVASAFPEIVQQLIATFDAWDAQNARPLWDFNTTNYLTPEFIREDIRVGSVHVSYRVPEFLPGSNKVAFQNSAGEIWIGEIDPKTGGFVSATGQDQQVDTRFSTFDRLSWGLSTNGPALFYSKITAGQGSQIWRARAADNFVPDPLLTSPSGFAPRASQNPNDPSVYINFIADGLSDTNAWFNETDPGAISLLARAIPATVNSCWIPNGRNLVYAGYPTPQSTVSQLIHLDTATGLANLITTGPENKTDARAFLAAELDGEVLYVAITARTNLNFYRALPDGTFSNVVSIAFPPNAPMPDIYSLETLPGGRSYNGTSYFCFTAARNGDPGDTSIWLLSLGPDWNHLIRRVDNDPLDSGVPSQAGRHDPKFVIGESELFIFYSLGYGDNVQLRRARTGIKPGDFRGEPTGFTELQYTRDFTAGSPDPTGRAMNNTETTALVAHNGWLFAGEGSHMATPYPTNAAAIPTNWSGAQILVKTSSFAPWRVDYTATNKLDPFPIHRRVEAIKSLQLSTPAGLSNFIVASMSDITSTGALAASVRFRAPDGEWKHSHVTTASEEAYPTAFASHTVGNNRIIFAGLSNGQIHRGSYNANTTNLVWNTAHELRIPGAGITSFAETSGNLYAATGLAQSDAGELVQGGIYIRADSTAEWFPVYRPPYPTNVYARPAQDFLIRGLTAAPAPNGDSREVLLFARWPGVIEHIDPINDYAAITELDLRDFFARNLAAETLRESAITAAYTGFTAATNPVTGAPIHIVGVWLKTANSAPESHFLVRHLDATYELAVIPNAIVGTELRATRAIAISPFAEDGGAVFYFGGYDTGGQESHNTAWIERGDWFRWPSLTISRPNPPEWQLTWPAASEDWLLESTTSILSNWQTVGEFTTRSTTENAISVSVPDPTAFYRLRRP